MNERKVIILKRKNYGRDFGAYKYGLLWIFENFNREKIESLILVNDTLNWPESSRRIITTAQGAQWGGMYLNLADNTHVNSFFMVFDGSVVNNKHFIKFWENYLPSQYKRHAIHKGEIRLSTTLLKAGFIPSVLVTALNLEESIAKLDRAKLLVLFDLPTVSIYPSSDHFFPQNEKLKILEEISEVKKLSTNELRREVLGHLLRHLYRDSPHSIGLHLFVLDLYPTKRDLYKYYPLSSIERALNVHSRFFSKLVIEDFEKTMTKRMIGLKKQKVMRTLGEA